MSYQILFPNLIISAYGFDLITCKIVKWWTWWAKQVYRLFSPCFTMELCHKSNDFYQPYLKPKIICMIAAPSIIHLNWYEQAPIYHASIYDFEFISHYPRNPHLNSPYFRLLFGFFAPEQISSEMSLTSSCSIFFFYCWKFRPEIISRSSIMIKIWVLDVGS